MSALLDAYFAPDAFAALPALPGATGLKAFAMEAKMRSKVEGTLDKIDAHQHEKELKVQEKLKASERRVSIRSATSSSRRATSSPTCTCPPTL